MTHKFYPEEVDRLKKEYGRMKAIRFDMNGSAAGEHYLLVKSLKEMGVNSPFESSASVENYIEHVLETGESPNVY